MKTNIGNIVKLAYFVVIFASLLLLSAVAERGETEMSRRLVPRMFEVPQMIEALIAGMTFAGAGGTAAAYIEKKNEGGERR